MRRTVVSATCALALLGGPALIAVEFDGLGAAQVTVLGGEQAVSAAVADRLAATAATVTRAAGADRSGMAIAAMAFPDGAETVHVATGAAFAAALAARPVADLSSAPVLLVTADGVPSATASPPLGSSSSATRRPRRCRRRCTRQSPCPRG